MTTDQKIYQEIGQAFVENSPQEWTSLKLVVQYGLNRWTESAWVQTASDSSWASFDCDLPFINMRDWLIELFQYTQAHNFKEWNTLTLMINSEGKFEVVFDWDENYQAEIENHS